MSYDTEIFRFMSVEEVVQGSLGDLRRYRCLQWVDKEAIESFLRTQVQDQYAKSKPFVEYVVEVGNITSNVGGMYRKAMPGPYPGGGRYGGTGEAYPTGGLKGLSGLTVKEALPILEKGLDHMRSHKDAYVEMEPPNKWGSYEGALGYLDRLYHCTKEASIDDPEYVIGVSW